jgi:hypothetical protein
METKKLTEEEITQITTLQQKKEVLINELGQIELVKFNLKERENKAKEFYDELLIEETTVAKELTDKYGSGKINLDTGEIVIE